MKVKLTLRLKHGTREIVVSDSVLDMLSEPTRKIVMDEALDGNQRFRALMEELHWMSNLSTHKIAKVLNIKYEGTLWKIMRRMGVDVRDNVTALRLANTGRYKYVKRDFDGSDAEKLKLWFLAHTDGSVQLDHQQVKVMLGTPDPYLALLFKELFARYGHVGLAPYRDNRGRYAWWLWVYLPLKSFRWLLNKYVPAPMDEGKLYDALSVAIDAEGTINAQKRTRARTTEFRVFLYNEKEYIIAPLQHALARLGYNPRPGKVPKGRTTSYGSYNNDYYSFIIYNKANVKRLLEHLKLALPYKRLKACLIRYALSDPAKPVYWEDVGSFYTEINHLHEGMLTESKRLAEELYLKRLALKELLRSKHITKEQYERERVKLESEAWSALEELKTRYDEKFSNLERRIEARFRARRPHASP